MKLRFAFIVLFCFLGTISGSRKANNVCTNGFLDAYPFFGDNSETPMPFKAQQMAFLIEFSRFMNLRAPAMLKVRRNARRTRSQSPLLSAYW